MPTALPALNLIAEPGRRRATSASRASSAVRDGHRRDSPQKLGSQRTHRWGGMDSNHRYLEDKLPLR
jgi:hypothetical protein